MKQKPKTCHSNDQAKLKVLCDDLCDRIEDLLDHFGLEYKLNDKMVTMACPIHGGDNIGAINLYPNGDTYRGNWKCRTHSCEKIFKGSIIGFVRGLLSAQKGWSQPGDNTCSFAETISFVSLFLNKDIKDIKISKTSRNKQEFANAINNIIPPKNDTNNFPTKDVIRQHLEIPAKYYLDRNFSKEILIKYDIGYCNKKNKEMSDRIVVPIYDINHEYMIGCSGRSIHEKCSSCSCFHSQEQSCPDDSKRFLYSKWKHSSNFKSQNCLYNMWYAKKHIQDLQYAIIVESPGNVWRLEEAGIHNSVGIFGCNLSDRQKMILDASGAMTLIVLTDNDEAGDKAAEQIKEKCINTYKIYRPKISKSDIGEMTIEEINQEIKLYIYERIL